MKNIPLRKRYFRDQALLGSIVVGLCLVALVIFNVIEIVEHHENREEEIEELVFLVGIFLLLLPVVYWLAWRSAGRLLVPLQTIREGMERIRGGELEQTLPVSGTGDDLDYLVESLNEGFQAYHETLRRLEAFSGNVAHQLRTPLTAIHTAGQVRLGKEATAEELRETMADMLEETDHLVRVVDQLLLLARVSGDAGSFEEQVHLGDLTREVLEPFQELLLDRGAEVETDISELPVFLEGNPVWLREALVNLLNNALTYCPDPLKLRVALAQRDGKIFLELEDNGPGVPPDQVERLFTRFERGLGRVDGGSGLGLAIVREIMEQHSGTITYQTSRWGGAGFTLEFPG